MSTDRVRREVKMPTQHPVVVFLNFCCIICVAIIIFAAARFVWYIKVGRELEQQVENVDLGISEVIQQNSILSTGFDEKRVTADMVALRIFLGQHSMTDGELDTLRPVVLKAGEEQRYLVFLESVQSGSDIAVCATIDSAGLVSGVKLLCLYDVR